MFGRSCASFQNGWRDIISGRCTSRVKGELFLCTSTLSKYLLTSPNFPRSDRLRCHWNLYQRFWGLYPRGRAHTTLFKPDTWYCTAPVLPCLQMSTLTHCTPGDVEENKQVNFSNSFYNFVPWAVPAKLVSGKRNRTVLRTGQHWFR